MSRFQITERFIFCRFTLLSNKSSKNKMSELKVQFSGRYPVLESKAFVSLDFSQNQKQTATNTKNISRSHGFLLKQTFKIFNIYRICFNQERGVSVCQGGACLSTPPPDRMTDTCKNINLPQIRCGR